MSELARGHLWLKPNAPPPRSGERNALIVISITLSATPPLL
jgi:hypothetical protein